MEKDQKTVGIVGAGVSGLLACKYVLQKGFHPIVFEKENYIGGVWAHTYSSTRLQTSRQSYQFTDFPWPSEVTNMHPVSSQVMDYLSSYANRFGVLSHVMFGMKVTGIDYVGVPDQEYYSWDCWSGMCGPFGSKGGKWKISVRQTVHHIVEVYEVDFIILCVGRFSGIPNIPSFPPGRGIKEFGGKVIHSIDYSNMDNAAATELIRGKSIAVVGYHKSAIDLALECANENGAEFPCTVVCRTKTWTIPAEGAWWILLSFIFYNRFFELMVHKPGEGKLLSLLATLLMPLRWATSKFVEMCIRWKLPLKKYRMVPEHSLYEALFSCSAAMIPTNFYGKVEKGSIILKRSQSLGFCKEGLLINDQVEPLKVDLVVLCTGYRGDDKLREMFTSLHFQRLLTETALYRGCIHPRIPQLAIIGYLEGPSVLSTTEMRCKWLSHLLAGTFQLPNIVDMEEETKEWEDYKRHHAGNSYKASCAGLLNIWCNDKLCQDMGYHPWRKKGILAEWLFPYGPMDYKDM